MRFVITALVGRKAFVVKGVGVELIQNNLLSHTFDATAENGYHLGLFPFSRKCTGKYRVINNLSQRTEYDRQSESFGMRALTLSGPGDLFSGRDAATRRTSSHDTVQ